MFAIMSRTKHSSPTQFAYPVARICGKISRHSDIVHSCTASGKSITYIQGKRDYSAHPVTPDEQAAKDLFSRRIVAVGARIKKASPTYADDLAAFRAQVEDKDGLKSFKSYIWSLVKAEITE